VHWSSLLFDEPVLGGCLVKATINEIIKKIEATETFDKKTIK
jgi:hypothetical protein